MSTKRLAAQITIGGAVSGALKSALGTTKDKLTEIGAAARKLSQEQRMLGNSINTFGAMGKNVDGLRARYAAVTAEIEKTRAAQAKLKAASEMSSKGGSMMAGAGIKFGVVAAAAATVGMTVGQSAEFEYQLQLIGNTANMSRAEVVKLGDAIMQASVKTGQSAETMQKAVGFLVAAGMDSNTAQTMMVQLGRTATATGADIEDLAKAAYVLNDTLKIKPGEEMAAAMDTMAQAGKEGNVELRDMAKQLPVLGAGFASLKMGGREAAATMAAALEVARKGAADADEAANNMKNFIAKVMSPETLKKAKKDFGIDLYKIIQDAQSKGGNPFEASMQAIIKATQGDQKKIGELFGDMQVQNFLRPMIQNWEEYTRIKGKSLSASGVIDQDFATMSLTTKIQLMQLTNAASRAVVVIGGALSPAFNTLAAAIVPVVGAVTSFVKEHEVLVGNVAAAAAGIGVAVASWQGLVFAFGVGMKVIGTAMASNPVGLLAMGVAAAAALIYKNWDSIVAGATWVGDTIKKTVGAAIEWVMQKIAYLGEAWAKTKAFFGVVDGGAPSGGSSTASSAPPAIPAMRGGTAAGPTYNTTNAQQITINQQPGQNSKELADEVARRLKEREGVQRRGMMYDHAMGY